MQNVGLFGVIIGVILRLWPVWASLFVLVAASLAYRRKLGLYGHVMASSVGLAGAILCAFWLFAAIFAHVVAPFGPQIGRAHV